MNDPIPRRITVISQGCRASASPAQCQRDCAGYIDPVRLGADRRCEHVCHDSVNPPDLDRAFVLARRRAEGEAGR